MNRPLLAAALLFLGASAAYGDPPPPGETPPVPHTRPHHRHHHAAANAPPAAAPVAQQATGPKPVTSAETPAPVPDENIGPPRSPPGTDSSIDPGTLQLHYPGVGNGYLPGSSSAALDNARAAKVPGVIANIPIQSAPPPPLPPIQNGH